jgi:hypothetical protein
VAWELLKLGALKLLLISMAEIAESFPGSFTGPCIQSPPGHIIKVLVVLHPATTLLIRNTDHYYH